MHETEIWVSLEICASPDSPLLLFALLPLRPSSNNDRNILDQGQPTMLATAVLEKKESLKLIALPVLLSLALQAKMTRNRHHED